MVRGLFSVCSLALRDLGAVRQPRGFEEYDGENEVSFLYDPKTRRGIVHQFVTLMLHNVLIRSANMSTGVAHVIFGTALIWLGS